MLKFCLICCYYINLYLCKYRKRKKTCFFVSKIFSDSYSVFFFLAVKNACSHPSGCGQDDIVKEQEKWKNGILKTCDRAVFIFCWNFPQILIFEEFSINWINFSNISKITENKVSYGGCSLFSNIFSRRFWCSRINCLAP